MYVDYNICTFVIHKHNYQKIKRINQFKKMHQFELYNVPTHFVYCTNIIYCVNVCIILCKYINYKYKFIIIIDKLNQ